MTHRTLYILGSLGLATLLLTVSLMDARQVEDDDGQSGDHYVIERTDGLQLFAMPDEASWTREIGYAARYGTLTQAQLGRDRIGAGHVAVVREVLK